MMLNEERGEKHDQQIESQPKNEQKGEEKKRKAEGKKTALVCATTISTVTIRSRQRQIMSMVDHRERIASFTGKEISK